MADLSEGPVARQGADRAPRFRSDGRISRKWSNFTAYSVNSVIRLLEQDMPTTHHLHGEIARLNRLITRIASKPKDESPLWAATLQELHDEREALGLVVRNRSVESGKKVVSFRRWRDGPRAP
jgi:hypothetical protein